MHAAGSSPGGHDGDVDEAPTMIQMRKMTLITRMIHVKGRNRGISGAGAQQRSVIDRVPTGEHRPDHRERLDPAARTMAGQPDPPIDQLIQPHLLRQRRGAAHSRRHRRRDGNRHAAPRVGDGLARPRAALAAGMLAVERGERNAARSAALLKRLGLQASSTCAKLGLRSLSVRRTKGHKPLRCSPTAAPPTRQQDPTYDVRVKLARALHEVGVSLAPTSCLKGRFARCTTLRRWSLRTTPVMGRATRPRYPSGRTRTASPPRAP